MTENTIVTYEARGNSVTFCRDGPLWLTDIAGTSGTTVSISEAQGAGQIGSTISDQSVQPRDITFTGAVIAETELNRRGMLSCILPGVTGRLTVLQNGESWYIDGAPKSTPEFSDGATVQDFQFTLHCPYPYWRSAEGGSTQIAGLTPLFKFPFNTGGKWWISQYSQSLFATVTNHGSVPLEFDILLTAATKVKNPEIYHVERGTSIKINRIMAAGETFAISTVYGRKGATLTLADGTKENGFRYLDVTSDLNMQLDPGENTIRYDAENNREGLRVTIDAPKGVVPGV